MYRNAMGIIAASIVTLSVVGCGETITPQAVNNTSAISTTSSKPAAPATQIFKVGQSVQFGDLIITVNGVRSSKGADFNTPSKGYFLLVDVSVKNTGSQAQDVSSIMNTSVKDADNYKYDITIDTEAKGSLDGQVQPGQSLRGEVAFDVPASKSYQFIYEDPFNNGQAIWELGSLGQ